MAMFRYCLYFSLMILHPDCFGINFVFLLIFIIRLLLLSIVFACSVNAPVPEMRSIDLPLTPLFSPETDCDNHSPSTPDHSFILFPPIVLSCTVPPPFHSPTLRIVFKLELPPETSREADQPDDLPLHCSFLSETTTSRSVSGSRNSQCQTAEEVNQHNCQPWSSDETAVSATLRRRRSTSSETFHLLHRHIGRRVESIIGALSGSGWTTRLGCVRP